MPSGKCKKILVAPLDWGLGHTTRCIPLMRYLLETGHNVVFAGNEWQAAFINKTFGSIDIIHLEGYNVHYTHSSRGFLFSIGLQVPHIVKTIRSEHKWLKQQVATHKFDGIISDNRYGLHHEEVPSVIMTHQLQVQTGIGKTADLLFRKLHYTYLNRFNACWVVDVHQKPGLAGTLSHPDLLPAHSSYLGLLSQFAPQVAASETSDPLLVLLSGPEPQRSMLSALLWQQVQAYKGQVVFVEGTDNAAPPGHIPPNVCYYKRLTNDTLLPILQHAGMVICRSGYSTIMDLVRLNKKAILIPTPGQTEQEYLGRYLHDQGIYYCANQKNFNLQESLNDIKIFPFRMLMPRPAYDAYKAVLDEWLERL